MSGMELARRICSRYPTLRIIMSTGGNVRLDAQQMDELNVRQVLAKPYGLDTLIDAAEQAMRR